LTRVLVPFFPTSRALWKPVSETGWAFRGRPDNRGETQEIAMNFRICGLAYEPFAPLFEMSERELHEHGSVRRIAPQDSTYPCRVSLRHAAPGETVILTNFLHLADPASPYRSSARSSCEKMQGLPSIASTRFRRCCRRGRCRCAPIIATT
jgi:hypothetical protein